MHLSKVSIALRAFSEPQFKRLKEYIHSPYFKVSPAATSLFDYLSPLYPSFPEKKLDTQPIAKKCDRLSTYAIQRRAGTELLHAIEQFIGFEHQRLNQPDNMLHQLHGFKQMGLFKHFHKDYDHILQQLEQCPEQHTGTFFHRHLFSELSFNERDLLQRNKPLSDLTPAITSLDEFYALKKLHYLCEAHIRNQVNAVLFPANQIAALLKTLKPFNNRQYPCAHLFVNIYHLLTASTYRQSQPYYKLLKEYATPQPSIVNGQSSISPPPALSEGINYIIYHILYWYNKGYEEAGKEYLWWVEIKMEYGWLLEDACLPDRQGMLKPATFRNILVIAVNHKSAVWMEQFIAVCEPYLPPEDREANLCFGNGLLNYRMKKYKEATRFFMMAQAKAQPVFNCLIRRWQWICSYECDSCDDETLENQLLSFEKYLNRNKKELGQNKKLFDKFILYAAALMSGSEVNESRLTDLQNQPHFPAKHWLLQQFAAQLPTKTQARVPSVR